MTSQLITGRRDVSNNEMLGAKVANALKKILTSLHFRRRVSVEEQRAQKDARFLRGTQIAYMIYEYFQATGGDEAVRGLSDLSNISLQNDDAQDFDKMGPSSCSSKWNTNGNGPGRFTQVKITGFCSASDCIGYVWTRECSKQRTTKRHIDQTMRTRNFRARREKRQRGEKKWQSAVSGKQLDSVQLDNVRKETHAVSVMIEHLATDAARRTIVLSCTKSASTDWRKETITKFRSHRRKSFRKRRPHCVPTFPEVKVHEPVM